MPRNRTQKSLCIVDTCTLVYLNDVELARRPLQKWLWSEFEISYSEAVLSEFSTFRRNMRVQERWEAFAWRTPNITNYENAIFSSHQRKLVGGRCKHCRQITWNDVPFTPNLQNTQDKGERHNCCVALESILGGRYSQIILLSDDLQAKRDYVDHFLEVFPLGVFWSSLDFITYLFMRHRKNIALDDVKNALRDVNTKFGSLNSAPSDQEADSDKKRKRLVNYNQKVEHIAQILTRLPGGN